MADASHREWVDVVAAKFRRRQLVARAGRAAAIALPVLIVAAAVLMRGRRA